MSLFSSSSTAASISDSETSPTQTKESQNVQIDEHLPSPRSQEVLRPSPVDEKQSGVISKEATTKSKELEQRAITCLLLPD